MLRAGRSASGHERLMKTARTLHSAEVAQGVGEHEGTGLEVGPGPGGDLLALKRADAAQAHPHGPTLPAVPSCPSPENASIEARESDINGHVFEIYVKARVADNGSAAVRGGP